MGKRLLRHPIRESHIGIKARYIPCHDCSIIDYGSHLHIIVQTARIKICRANNGHTFIHTDTLCVQETSSIAIYLNARTDTSLDIALRRQLHHSHITFARNHQFHLYATACSDDYRLEQRLRR